MSVDIIFFAALYYVFVQCALLYSLHGFWRLAAFLPIPMISLCLCLGVLTSLLGPVLSTLLMTFALPLGTIYLICLAVVWLVCAYSRGLAYRRTSAP